MENKNALLEIRLTGNGIHPEALKVREVAELLKHLEDALFHVIASANSEIRRQDVYVSLTQVKDQSASYGVAPSLQALMVAGFMGLSAAIASGDYKDIPIRGIKSLQDIQKFARKKGCSTEFKFNNEVRAVLTPNSSIEIPANLYISGYTTIYPYIKKSGGSIPSIDLRINPNDPFLHVPTTEEIAKTLGSRLYSIVGLTGFAKWERSTKKLVDFKIEKVLSYRETSITDTFNLLSKEIGPYWDEIDDIESYLTDEYEE